LTPPIPPNQHDTMSIESAIHWYEATTVGTFLRSADPLLMEFAQLFHVFGLVVPLAAAILLSLRPFGIGLPGIALPRLMQTLKPFLLTGLVVTLASGLVMFGSVPGLYHISPAFWPKIGILAVAIAVQLALLRGLAGKPSSIVVRGSAALSLVLWFGVGAFGRAIAYVS
jgi:hypothetical protein